MLTRAQKEEQVVELKEKFGRATCVYVADYRGVDVKSVSELRGRIRKEGGGDYEYRVSKNSVLRRAAVDSDVAHLVDRFEGPTAVAITYGDAVGLAKILVDFAKEYEVFELKAGANRLAVELVGINPKAIQRPRFGIDYQLLEPLGPL